MKKYLIILSLFIGLVSYGQSVSDSDMLSFDYVDLMSDTTVISTIKTLTNMDFYCDGHFMSWSSNSERPFHFIYPHTSGYDVNRMTFTKTDIPYVYKSTHPAFQDSIGVDFNKGKIRIFNQNYQSLIFYNK